MHSQSLNKKKKTTLRLLAGRNLMTNQTTIERAQEIVS